MRHTIKIIAITLSTVFMLSPALIPVTVNTVEAGSLKKTFKKGGKKVKKGAKQGAAKSKWGAQRMKQGVEKGARAAGEGAKKGAAKLKKKLKR